MKIKSTSKKKIRGAASLAATVALLGGGAYGMTSSYAADTDPAPTNTVTPTASATSTGTTNPSTSTSRETTVKINTPVAKTKYKVGEAVPLNGLVNSNSSFGALGLGIDYSGSAYYDKIWAHEADGARSLAEKYAADLNKTPPTAISFFSDKVYTLGPESDAEKVKALFPDTNNIFEVEEPDPVYVGEVNMSSTPRIPGVKSADILDKLGGAGENCDLAINDLKAKFASTPGHKDFWIITDGGCSSAADTAVDLGPDYTVNIINTNQKFTNDSEGCGVNAPSGKWAALNGGICKIITDPKAIAAEVKKLDTRAKTVKVTITGDNGYSTTQDVTASQLIDGSWKGTDLTGLKPGNYTATVNAAFNDGSARTDSTTFVIEAEPTPEPTTPEPTTPEPTTPEPTTPAPVITTPAPVTTTPAPVTTTPAPVTTTPPAVTETVTQPPVVETTTPAPVVVTPAPVTVTPKPVVVVGPTVQTDYIK